MRRSPRSCASRDSWPATRPRRRPPRAGQRRPAGPAVGQRRHLVTAAYERGARHLFRPAAVAAQVVLALAGLAALPPPSPPASISCCGSTRPRYPWSSA